MGGHTVTVGVFYKHCSEQQLHRRMIEKRQGCMEKNLSREAIDWIDSNIVLIKELKRNENFNVQITAEDFSDMNFPSYQLIKNDYKCFLESYTIIQTIYNGKYQIFYDEDLK